MGLVFMGSYLQPFFHQTWLLKFCPFEQVKNLSWPAVESETVSLSLHCYLWRFPVGATACSRECTSHTRLLNVWYCPCCDSCLGFRFSCQIAHLEFAPAWHTRIPLRDSKRPCLDSRTSPLKHTQLFRWASFKGSRLQIRAQSPRMTSTRYLYVWLPKKQQKKQRRRRVFYLPHLLWLFISSHEYKYWVYYVCVCGCTWVAGCVCVRERGRKP